MLSKKVLASYSAVSLPLAAMAMPMAVYLPPFYAEAESLDLTTVGLIFTLARIWDVITDPLMGMAIDKYETRWGRRKHWVAISIPILLLSVYMVYLPDPADITPLYLGGWLLLLYIGYTMLGIAHQSWGAETDHHIQRPFTNIWLARIFRDRGNDHGIGATRWRGLFW